MARPNRLQIPLRLRLTLWYTLSLTLILVLFSIFVYFQLQGSLIDQVDSSLYLAANQTLLNVDQDGGQLSFQGAQGNAAAVSNLSDDYIISLFDDQGNRWDEIKAGDEQSIRDAASAGFQTLTHDEEPWRVYRQAINRGDVQGWIQVAQELDPLESILDSLQTQLFIGLPLALLLAGIGGYFLAAGALRPIDHMTRTAQTISAAQLNQRINYQGPQDEVGRLAKTFDSMLDRLQAAFTRERRFTGDAAHELRTPLTALKGQIGVTLSQPRAPEVYQKTLQGMDEEVDRLIRLSNDLLFMARLEQESLSLQRETIDLAGFLAAVCDQVQPLAAAKTIAIMQHIPPALQVRGDMELLLRLFMNLLHNAVKYSPPDSRISLTASRKGEWIKVQVSDSGPGIAPEHLPHIFERFYRIDDHRARDIAGSAQGGAGLGLSIAREIAHFHKGDLQASSTPGQGTTFTVTLPAAG